MRAYLYSLAMVALLFAGNAFGNYLGWYSSVTYYDIFMHILGGLSIGLCSAAFIELHGLKMRHKKTFILFSVLAAGLAWECFEAYYNIAGAPVGTDAYYFDSAKDIINDLIGGLLAVMFELRNLKAKIA